MREFKNYHPFINLIYFVFVIGFSVVSMHPVSLCISFITALLYSVVLEGKKAVKFMFIFMLPLMILAAVVNPLFNHQGMMILAYFPSGNPLTFEAVVYGFASSAMLAAVMCYFFCFNIIMTKDKLTYLFGRIIPSVSLVFTMTLRFVPKFSAQLKQVVSAQKAIGNFGDSSVKKRAKQGLSVLSVMTTWALENSIETADSMKSRGYGTGKRTSFSNVRFEKRDGFALCFMIVAGAYAIIGTLCGVTGYEYFPVMEGVKISGYGVSVFAVYFLLCIFPVIAGCLEEGKWKLLKQKI